MAAPAGRTALNGICPYFTMFPLDFPLGILSERARRGDPVLDPFCGRGTTNFAARLLGLRSLGVDTSPVAIAITAAKLVQAEPAAIVAEAQRILADIAPCHIPTGEFWRWAYHPTVLAQLCQFRETFLHDCTSSERRALRGIILGALHGPKTKQTASYFSNQAPRTYAPKPGYAVRYWKVHALWPENVDCLALIERRAHRYYSALPEARGDVRLADSRQPDSLRPALHDAPFTWVITSPPYYGMRTYLPDQWLRNWFLGGPDVVQYQNPGEVVHSSPEAFASDLRTVWRNAAAVCQRGAKLVVRFGGITDRRADPLQLIRASLADTDWRITAIQPAGSAHTGKRQADTFLRRRSKPMSEYDVWAERAS